MTPAGLAATGPLVCVQPLDAAGNPTPAWSLKIHVALAVVPLTALPSALALVAGGGWLAGPASWPARCSRPVPAAWPSAGWPATRPPSCTRSPERRDHPATSWIPERKRNGE